MGHFVGRRVLSGLHGKWECLHVSSARSRRLEVPYLSMILYTCSTFLHTLITLHIPTRNSQGWGLWYAYDMFVTCRGQWEAFHPAITRHWLVITCYTVNLSFLRTSPEAALKQPWLCGRCQKSVDVATPSLWRGTKQARPSIEPALGQQKTSKTKGHERRHTNKVMMNEFR